MLQAAPGVDGVVATSARRSSFGRVCARFAAGAYETIVNDLCGSSDRKTDQCQPCQREHCQTGGEHEGDANFNRVGIQIDG